MNPSNRVRLVTVLAVILAFLGIARISSAASPAASAKAAASAKPAASTKPEANEAEAADEGEKLPWKIGPAPIDLGHGANLALPDGYRFLGQPEAGKLMEAAGNLHNENLLGIVLSNDENAEFSVTLRYDEEGFIKDDEKLDGKEILESIREGEEEYNKERKARGFPSIHADGWLEDPRYDKANHHVVWGLLVSSPEEPGTSVNFNTRVLGRRGYLSVNLITDKDALAQYRPVASTLLGATTFSSGNRYEDFNSGTDKVAEYGLTGLVLGGAGFGIAKAVKIGLLAKFGKFFLAILVAGKKAVVFVLAGAAALLKKIFGKKDAPPASPA